MAPLCLIFFNIRTVARSNVIIDDRNSVVVLWNIWDLILCCWSILKGMVHS